MEPEKQYFGKKFFESGLNTILLLVLIVLMIIAFKFMYENKRVYSPISNLNEAFQLSTNIEAAPDQSDNVLNPNQAPFVVDDKSDKTIEYKNDNLGISFSYPAQCGELKQYQGQGIDDGTIYLEPDSFELSEKNIFCPLLYFNVNLISSHQYDGEGECDNNASLESDESVRYVNSNKVSMVINPGQNGACGISDELIEVEVNFTKEQRNKIKLFEPIFYFQGIKGENNETKVDFMKIIDSIKLY